ncbi:unnamed protein product, partial [Laminaria digitata]
NRLVATAHSDGYIFLWDMRTGRALSSVIRHKDQTRFLDFSVNGNSLLTASYDGLVSVCDCRKKGQPDVDVSVSAMLRAHGGRVLQARWRPTAGPPAFLTSSTDCTVMLWSLPEGRG